MKKLDRRDGRGRNNKGILKHCAVSMIIIPLIIVIIIIVMIIIIMRISGLVIAIMVVMIVYNNYSRDYSLLFIRCETKNPGK